MRAGRAAGERAAQARDGRGRAPGRAAVLEGGPNRNKFLKRRIKL